MYYLVNPNTGTPAYTYLLGKVKKVYSHYAVAQKDADKAQELRPTLRCDVVEISKSARLYLENQARLVLNREQ